MVVHPELTYEELKHVFDQHGAITYVPDDEIISMVVHKDVLYVAAKSGVYAKDGNGVFHKLKVGDNGAA